MNIPRVLLAAPKSGSGKTLLTCAFLGALKKQNKDVMAFKCGPDYIDPMFHRTVQQVPCENIDSFFLGEENVNGFFCSTAKGHGVAVIEGVMGLFDGQSVENNRGSAYEIAYLTKTPVVLIVDVHGMGRSMIPLIRGFLDFDSKKLIKGIILNRITPMFYNMIKPVLDQELSVPVTGYFPKRNDMDLESRHLGLKLPEEVVNLEKQLNMAAEQFLDTCGYDQIMKIAENAESPADAQVDNDKSYDEAECESSAFTNKDSLGIGKYQLTLGVARDEAFCFYYDANIRLFEKYGVKIRYFSPIHDKNLPEEIDGFLIGGGYPELYAEKLSENKTMLASVKAAIEKGMPSLAECGGFMYLHDTMTDPDGKYYKMAGVIDGSVTYTGKPVRFGYITVSENRPAFLKEGQSIRGHEFHYFDSTSNGEDCIALKPSGNRSWKCIHENNVDFWGFPHLYYPSAPDFVVHFIREMDAHKRKQNSSEE